MNTSIKVPVTRLWHKKSKLEYFTMFQLKKFFPEIDFEFHIILDNFNYQDEWSAKIDELGYKTYWYSKEDMHKYLIQSGYCNEDDICKIKNFVHFYHILINHYVRRVYSYSFSLSIEYDVIFNSEDLIEINDLLVTQTPFGIIEPANPNCDKALANKLSQLFNQNIVKYPNLGFNAGLQGVNLQIFDEFLSPSGFKQFFNIFDFSGIYDKNGNEKTGWERTLVDTQEQSFHSLMTSLSPNFKVLDPILYYVFPYWIDMEYLKKSKIIHFIGHEKPEIMFEMIEQNLKN